MLSDAQRGHRSLSIQISQRQDLGGADRCRTLTMGLSRQPSARGTSFCSRSPIPVLLVGRMNIAGIADRCEPLATTCQVEFSRLFNRWSGPRPQAIEPILKHLWGAPSEPA